jgi:hypothetical protein
MPNLLPFPGLVPGRYLERLYVPSPPRPPEMDIKWGFVDLYLAISRMDELYAITDKEPEML